LEYGNDNEADEENAVGGKYKLVKWRTNLFMHTINITVLH
jgi:hypothetical protein